MLFKLKYDVLFTYVMGSEIIQTDMEFNDFSFCVELLHQAKEKLFSWQHMLEGQVAGVKKINEFKDGFNNDFYIKIINQQEMKKIALILGITGQMDRI